MRWLLAAVVLTLALGVVAGCRRAPGAAAVSKVKEYKVRGKVVSTNPANGSVMLDHEAIPGFMGAMTMEYRLKDPGTLSELHEGDRITARLEAEEDAAGPMNMRLDRIVVVGQARPDTKPKMQYHVPAVGDAVPDVALLNQSGKKIRLSQFHGKVVVLTFIYTRCTLTEFCLRMSRNFAEMDKALAEDPAVYAKTHLVSISFDPEYDKPAVLRSYGGAYTGKYSKETFGHWDFAAPAVADLPGLEQFFDLGVTPGEGKTLNHSLATVIVGKDGKVVAYYPTNDWTTGDLLKQIRAAAAA
jgi:protein SCO1/2